MPLSVGHRLGPYEILASIGAGGMGEVYKARDTRLGRIVAIKVSKSEFSERFEREARAVAALNHPNICHLYDVGPDYLVMEYIDGRPLQGPLPFDQAVKYAVQICDALDAAHRKGVIHRDLKPANILLTVSGVKLLDFGLAKMLATTGPSTDETATLELTQAGMIVGTPQYMSPEQIEAKDLDTRSDVFSFGVILYEILTGKPPFTGSSIPGIIAAVLHEQPKPASGVRPGIPKDFDRIISRCLEKLPARRFESMEEIKSALAGAAVRPEDARASIAVLPFANLSADKENEYFGDGLAEEIINELTHVAGLRVIARTSAFAFKGKQEDVRRIAEMLGVANILEGSVRSVGSRIRVTAQLITAADGSHLWSERYDREMTDVFAVQDEIARAVVYALKDRLGASAGVRPVQRHSVDIEAYHLYVKGLHYWHKNTPDGAEAARRLFEQALTADPNYALPLSATAQAHFLSTMTGATSANETAPLGIQAAEKALALDNSLGEALAARALFRALYEYHWDEALREFARAFEISPSAAMAPHLFAIVFATLHRLPDAVRWQELALKTDPFRPINHYFLARLLACLGEYDRAAEHAERAVEIAPEHWAGHAALGLIRLFTGNAREAIRAFEKEPAPLAHYGTGWRGCAYVLAGQQEQAEQLLRELRLARERHYVSHFPSAMICAQLGDSGAAFEHLTAAVDQRDFQLYNLQIDPAFTSLRSDPRYAALLRTMRLQS